MRCGLVGHGRKRRHQGVDNPMRGLVASRAGGRKGWMHNRAFTRHDLDRPIATMVGGYFRIGSGLQAKVGCRCGHVRNGIDRSTCLRIGVTVVDHQSVAVDDNLDSDRNRLVGNAVVVHDVFAEVLSIGPRPDHCAHSSFGIRARSFLRRCNGSAGHTACTGLDIAGRRCGSRIPAPRDLPSCFLVRGRC